MEPHETRASFIVVLADDLNRGSPLITGANPSTDLIWMAEAGAESGFVAGGAPAHKRRIAYYLSAMRHYRNELWQRGLRVRYHEIDARAADASAGAPGAGPPGAAGTAGAGAPGAAGAAGAEDPWATLFDADLAEMRPGRVTVTRPGDVARLRTIEESCRRSGTELIVVEDSHFLTAPDDFSGFMEGRRTPLLESFYRRIRRRENVLMTPEGKPEGGAWNFDKENREAFSKQGPQRVPAQPVFPHDEITRKVSALVERRFPDHPGGDAQPDLPVTPAEAEQARDAFIRDRLPQFGRLQDAMWTGEPFLYHSRLSAALNAKLIDPLATVRAAEAAYRNGEAPLNAVEGFIRQIMGWREFVRGVYFHYMPEYGTRNALSATEPLPALYWTGDTEMRCLREVIGGLIDYGYAHHIQRLMVTGLFALLFGVRPTAFNSWHIAMYIDALDWVSVPNTVGMSLYADGGTIGTKPYAASGKYIQRMSNYCRHCSFDPADAPGASACPFTTLYWTFLERHAGQLRGNRRMTFQLKNLERKSEEEMAAIRLRESEIRSRIANGEL